MEALRAWQTNIKDPQSAFSQYPEDYTLFELGEFDSFSGNIYPHTAPQSLGNALQFKAPEPHDVRPVLMNGKTNEINATL